MKPTMNAIALDDQPLLFSSEAKIDFGPVWSRDAVSNAIVIDTQVNRLHIKLSRDRRLLIEDNSSRYYVLRALFRHISRPVGKCLKCYPMFHT
jgi:hypothetical protein